MVARRERYTPSDIGPTPLDWDDPYLKDVSSLITNGFVGTATPYYTDESGVTYLYGTNIRANRIDYRDLRYITEEFHAAQSKTALCEGDLLTVQSGHIGTTAVVPKGLEDANCHALIVTRLDKGVVDPEFLSFYLNSEIGKARMRGLEVGSTILHINTKDLKKFRIPVPPMAEQWKIRRTISSWNAGIQKLEELVANSRLQKKALMQQLLTGKRRLPGFEERPWVKLKAKEVFGTVSRRNFPDEPLLAVTQDQAVVRRSDLERKVVMPEGSTTNYKLVEPGNFVISLRSFQGGLEYSDVKGLVSPAYHVLEASKDISDSFYKYYFKSWDFIGHLSVAVIGIRDGKQVSYGDFSFLSIPCPELDEQIAIAKVLDSADQQIESLKGQLLRLKDEQKALMQQLLSGKRRVKVDKEAA